MRMPAFCGLLSLQLLYDCAQEFPWEREHKITKKGKIARVNINSCIMTHPDVLLYLGLSLWSALQRYRSTLKDLPFSHGKRLWDTE